VRVGSTTHPSICVGVSVFVAAVNGAAATAAAAAAAASKLHDPRMVAASGGGVSVCRYPPATRQRQWPRRRNGL